MSRFLGSIFFDLCEGSSRIADIEIWQGSRRARFYCEPHHIDVRGITYRCREGRLGTTHQSSRQHHREQLQHLLTTRLQRKYSIGCDGTKNAEQQKGNMYARNQQGRRGKRANVLEYKFISIFSRFPPFLTISLCRAGLYLCHPVFSVLYHVFSLLVFLHIFLCVVPPSLFRYFFL